MIPLLLLLAPPGAPQLPQVPLVGSEYPALQLMPYGGCQFETSSDGRLPFQAGVLKVHSTIPAQGGWQAMLPLEGWRTLDLQPYLAKGAIQFDIKGADGGEQFSIGLRDRYRNQSADAVLKSGAEFSVTTQWQTVKVPLVDFQRLKPEFHFEGSHVLLLGSLASGDQTIWVKNVQIASPDPEKTYPAIKVNQVGYFQDGKKTAIVSQFPGGLSVHAGSPFRVIDSKTGEAVFIGKLSLVSERDSVSGDNVLTADFTSFKTPGTYRIQTLGIKPSYSFTISSDPYGGLGRDAARYYYLQRSGMPLEKQYAGIYARAEGHPSDRHAPYLSDNSKTRDVHGGWYDAGDYGKYVSMAAIPLSDLLYTQELFPKAYSDSSLRIPESGNGVPDLLDEIRWELEFILRMQDKNSGGFYPQIWPNNANATPDKDLPKRFVYDLGGGVKDLRPTYDSATSAAVLSHASLLYKPFDKEFSERLVNAAKQAWKYLESHPDNIRAEGMTDYQGDDKKGRLWAAGELFRATGDPAYATYVAAHGREFGGTWDDPRAMSYTFDVSMLGWAAYAKAQGAPQADVDWFKEHFDRWRGAVLARQQTLTWKNFLLPDGYYWGSNSVSLDVTSLLAIGNGALHRSDRESRDAARADLDYILGLNPISFSYVSGYGEASVRNIYSCIYANDGLPSIPPGYLAGGANKQEGKLLSAFPGKCYRDSDGDWTVNENAIYWNSALVISLAFARFGPG